MNHRQISACFNRLFSVSHNTVMRGGGAEPLYIPAAAKSPAQLIYREDFAASALHEAAHWCVAGARRRRQVDFGYGYQAPPRDGAAQAQFYRLELKVQTLEALFAGRAGVRFAVSADNLQADTREFACCVQANLAAVEAWMDSSPDRRALHLYQALGDAANG